MGFGYHLVAGITILNEGQDIVVLVDTGQELIEVIRERGRFNIDSGTMDHSYNRRSYP